jgi:hypothetical protein
MSQIVSAFAVPATALLEAQRHLSAGDWSGFSQALRAFQVAADFAYSGYVVVVAVEYLRELGIELPVSQEPVVREIVEHCGPLACTNRAGATAAATALAGVNAPDAELAKYWRNFTGDEELDAGTAMRSALEWLRHAFAAGQESDWFIILEG